MKTIMFVFGTRPEAIKMTPVIKRFQKTSKFDVRVCVTGQHRGMLDDVLTTFEIKPDYDLNVMEPNQTLTDVTTRIMQGLDTILNNNVVDLVIVHGDTTTALAASLTAFYHKIPIAHVEAGLRTNNMQSPFPEEANRQIIDRISTLLFPPTHNAVKNLIDERLLRNVNVATGNTAIDALKYTLKKKLPFSNKYLYTINYNNDKFNFKKIILVTAHRRENCGKPLYNIANALYEIAKQHKDIHIIYPVHPNPKVREQIQKSWEDQVLLPHNVSLIDPLNYPDMVKLMSMSYLILTDSGGIQEEATYLKIPTLILREETERPEVVDYGFGEIVGSNTDKIVGKVNSLLNKVTYNKKIANMGERVSTGGGICGQYNDNPFGNGKASDIIYKSVCKYFKFKQAL